MPLYFKRLDQFILPLSACSAGHQLRDRFNEVHIFIHEISNDQVVQLHVRTANLIYPGTSR